MRRMVVRLLAFAGNKLALFIPSYCLLWIGLAVVIGLPFKHIPKNILKAI